MMDTPVAMLEKFGNSLHGLVLCPICRGVVKDPVSGECLHRCCRVCLEKYIRVSKKPKCPICKARLSYRQLRNSGVGAYGVVEYVMTDINNDERCKRDGGEVLIPFTQSATAESPAKLEKPPSPTHHTPAKATVARVAKTPARGWGKKRRIVDPSQNDSNNDNDDIDDYDDGNGDEKENLFKALESAELVSSKKKKKRKTLTSPTDSGPPKSKLFGGVNLEACKKRAMDKLLENARIVEASGVVPPSALTKQFTKRGDTKRSLESPSISKLRSYDSPQPTTSKQKIISPFVLKEKSTKTTPVSVETTPQLPLKTDKSTRGETKKDPIEIGEVAEGAGVTGEMEDEDDSIGPTTRKQSRPLATPSEDEEEDSMPEKRTRDVETAPEAAAAMLTISPGVVEIKNAVVGKKGGDQDVIKVGVKRSASIEVVEPTKSPKRVLETPIIPHVDIRSSADTPGTPETPVVIQATNTVLETPHGRIRSRAVKETPIAVRPSQRPQTISQYASTKHRALQLTETDQTVPRGTPRGTRLYKPPVVEQVKPTEQTPSKKSPSLKIDKDGNVMNYTIEQDAGKLTIIQEGQLMSPKLMKHIYEDILHSDPDSCSELINSLSESMAPPTKKRHGDAKESSPKREEEQKEEDHMTGGDLFGDSVPLNTVEFLDLAAARGGRECERGEEESQENGDESQQKEEESQRKEEESHEKQGEILENEKDVEEMEKEEQPEADSLEGFTYDQAAFDMNDYKRTFGLASVKQSLSVPVEVPASPVKPTEVYDTVPIEKETPLHTSTQASGSRLVTPTRTIGSSSHVYTTQELERLQDQIKEQDEMYEKLKKLHQHDTIFVADTLPQPPDLFLENEPSRNSPAVDETLLETAETVQDSQDQQLFGAEIEFGSTLTPATLIHNPMSQGITEGDEEREPDRKTFEEEDNEEEPPTITETPDPRPQDEDEDPDKDPEDEDPDRTTCEEEDKEEEPPTITETPDPRPIPHQGDESPTGESAHSLEQAETGKESTIVLEPEQIPKPEPEQIPVNGSSRTGQYPDQSSVDHGPVPALVRKGRMAKESKRVGGPSMKERIQRDTHGRPTPVIAPGFRPPSDIPPTQERSPIISCRRPDSPETERGMRNRYNILLCSGTVGFAKEKVKKVMRLKQQVRRDTNRYSVRLLREYNDTVTHLIFVTEDSMTCGRTAKFLQGIAAGKWLLSYKWIEQSLELSKFVNEGPYELMGDYAAPHSYAPRSSRISRLMSQPPLFTNLTVFIVGEIKLMPRKEFIQIIETVGVNVLPSAGAADSEQSVFATQSQVRPLIDAVVTSRDEVTGYDLEPITAQWLLDCVANYKILPLNLRSRRTQEPTKETLAQTQ